MTDAYATATGRDYLDGFAARLLGAGWDCNPHRRTGPDFDPARRTAWREGWGRADDRDDAPALVRPMTLSPESRRALTNDAGRHEFRTAAERDGMILRQARAEIGPDVGPSDLCMDCRDNGRATLADFGTGWQLCTPCYTARDDAANAGRPYTARIHHPAHASRADELRDHAEDLRGDA